MKAKPFSLRIRIGAAYDDVTYNGHKFDRSRMNRDEQRNLRIAVVRGFADSKQKPSNQHKAR